MLYFVLEFCPLKRRGCFLFYLLLLLLLLYNILFCILIFHLDGENHVKHYLRLKHVKELDSFYSVFFLT